MDGGHGGRFCMAMAGLIGGVLMHNPTPISVIALSDPHLVMSAFYQIAELA
jgi:hypothetical protein